MPNFGLGKLKQSLSPAIQDHLLSSSDFLLRRLITANCQDELSLVQTLAPLLNGIREALGRRSLTSSDDDRHGDGKKMLVLEQRANYRMKVFQIRLR